MGYKKIMAAALTSGMILSFIPATVMADSSKWVKDDYGWRYVNGAGYVENEWRQDGGKWYYFQSQGYMVYGVRNYLINGIYYSFDNDGVCLNPDNKVTKYYGFHDRDFFEVYYSSIDGTYINTRVYYYEPDGKPAKGWREIDGSWYYFDKYDSYMYCENYEYFIPHCIDGNYYWFDEDGKMITGWDDSYYGWHYADDKGHLYIEKWLNDGGNWYYFDENGIMVNLADNFEIDGIDYDFDEDGACLNPDAEPSVHEPGWCQRKRAGDYYYSDSWFYYNDDGSLYTGWLSSGGNWYYLDPDSDSGVMLVGKNEIDGKCYFFDWNSGVMATGWFDFTPDGSGIYGYSAPNGEIYRNKWIFSGGKWYYAGFDGIILAEAVNYTINGIDYTFDQDGVCLNPDATEKTITGWYKRTTTRSVKPISGDNSVDYYYVTAWYYYDPEGVMVTGWRCIGNDWYYFNSDGTMKTGDFRWDGYTYRLRDTGEMVIGWFRDSYGSEWEYYAPDGIRLEDEWLKRDGKWYYFDENGRMLAGCENVLIKDVDYSFDIDGVCINPDAEPQKIVGWIKRYNPYFEPYYRNSWYYYDENGDIYEDKWLCEGGNWYYFYPSGVMANEYDIMINGLIYDFDSNGICQNPYSGRDAA